MIVRTAVEADRDALVALIDEKQTGATPEDEDAVRNNIDEYLLDPGSILYFLAEKDGKPVGYAFCMAARDDWDEIREPVDKLPLPKDAFFCMELFTLDDEAKAPLYDQALEHASRHGYKLLIADVVNTNDEAMRFHRSYLMKEQPVRNMTLFSIGLE